MRNYRVGPASKAYTDASYLQESHAFKGIGLRPLSPVHLKAVAEGGSHQISWIRRSRIDGDPWGESEVPLGETNELYRLRVMDGTEVKRQVDITSPSWIYTQAMRTTDVISAGYTIEVAQVSERFGAGPFTPLTVEL
jgi:hypothetical protein